MEQNGEVPSHADALKALRLIHVGMLKQARYRQWCSEYETFVQEINEKVGFEALGARIHRQTQSCRVIVRMRGSVSDNERALETFIDHVRGFVSDYGISFEVNIESWGAVDDEEETIGGQTERELEARQRMSPVVADCDCESCRRSRETVAAPARRRAPRFTDVSDA